MNILYFGSMDGTSSSLNYFTSLGKLGGTTLPFDPRYFDSSSPWERLGMRIRKEPGQARRQAAADQLLRLCKASRFDLVFVMSENFLSGDTIRAIRSQVPNPPKFIYHSHDNNYSSGILKPADFFTKTLVEYDHVFTTKSQNEARYRADGVRSAHYIPSAYEPAVHRPLSPEESRLGKREYEAVFVGTYDRSREAYMAALGWDHLNVWGSDWTRYSQFAKHRDRIIPHAIYYLEFADVMSHSKMALGILREEAEDRHTQRTFELPACGVLQLAPRNEEILGFFEEDREIVCFSSPQELSDKVHYYLQHDKQARKVADAGHKRCLAGGHAYDDRVTTILKIAAGAKQTATRARA